MYVLVSQEGGRPQVEIEDSDNLQQLHVEFRGVDDDAATAALGASGVGTVEEDHVWLHIASLRGAGDPKGDWIERFDAMVSYAKSKDLVDAEGVRVRSHIVRN